MDRLTAYICGHAHGKDGVCYKDAIKSTKVYRGVFEATAIVEKLAEYEDTGLTPEEITDLKEKINNTEWHREPIYKEKYWYYFGARNICITSWMDSEFDKKCFNNFNCFPCKDFTKKQLEAAGVARMALIERIAYTFRPDDWLTEEERLDNNIYGYFFTYDVCSKKWKTVESELFYEVKLYRHQETAEELCKWLNENCDHNGVMK